MCPLFLLAEQYVAPIKCCSRQAGGTGAHPSPVAGLHRAVSFSCSMPRGSSPQDPKEGLLPFCQDILNPKGKDKWQERGQKGLQGLWALSRAQGCSFCGGWELESVFTIPSPARAGESQGAAATHIILPWAGLGSGRAQIPLVSTAKQNHRAPQSFLCYLAGCARVGCAKILLFHPWRWEKWIPNGSPSVVPLHIPRHTILIAPKQTSNSWGHILKGQWLCQAFHKPNPAAPDAALPW